MTFTEREQKLIEFVKIKHGEQIRKYTKLPYYTHLVSVAERVYDLGPVAVAIALCHDLIEDTDCTLLEISKFLIQYYAPEETSTIIVGVSNLTDFYTTELFPFLNRKARKKLENQRLSKIEEISKSVKYADISDNIPSIVEHDLDFAFTFLKEKRETLSMMVGGDAELRNICLKVIEEGFIKIKKFVK